MKKVILLLSSIFLMSHVYSGQSKVTELPDISVIGNFIGQQSKAVKEFNVGEIEFAFQHYLYPDVKADVFAGLHKESNGERNFELEEAYITFSNFFGTLFPNQLSNLGIGAIIGKKRLGVGKLNPVHPESWDYVDRPLVINQFVGGGHGLAGEGLQLNYLLPLPFFSQIELGYWALDAHEEEGEESHGVEYESSIAQSRLWNSFGLSEDKEFEFGVNYVIGNPSSTVQITQQHVVGTDITYTQELGNDREFQLQGELYQAIYGEEGEAREKQSGAYVSGRYKFNNFYKLALRYGQLGKHGDEGNEKSQYAVSLTKQLTETSKFRIQYNSGDEIEDTVYGQFIFGVGPHSHVLQ